MQTLSQQVGRKGGNNESLLCRNGSGSIRPLVFDVPTTERPKHCEVGEWIDRISRLWARGPANTLALARLLHQARQNMKRGQWSDLWRSPRLPFSKRKAEMLVLIGQVLGGLNAKNSARLPTAWNTLYHLARLRREVVEQLIAEGKIHPRLSFRQARELAAQYAPTTIRKSGAASTLRRRLNRFSSFVRASFAEWTMDERELVRAELKQLLKTVESNHLANNLTLP